jgi:pyruvate,water dikinase
MSASTVLLGVREPFTPLGFDLMSQMFPTIINIMTARKKKLLTNNFVAYAGQRIYVDMTYLLSNRLVATQFANALSGNDLPLKGVMLQLIEDYGRQLRKQGIRFKLPLGFIKYGLSITSKMLAIGKIPNSQRYEAMKLEGNRWFANIVKDYERADTNKERLEFANKALVEAFKLSQVEAFYCIDTNNYIKIDKLLKKHFGDTYKVETLAQSLPGCFTQTMTIRLNEYAKSCKVKDIEPSIEDPDFKVLVKDYGHRGNIELDFGTARWREDPTYLLDLVKSYMVDDMFVRNLQNHKDKRQEAENMIEEVVNKLSSIIGKKRAEKFRTYMINYRYGAAMREYPKSDIVRFMELARKSVQVIGQRLVEEGRLDYQDDVFYLHQVEILKGVNLKEIVMKAKEAYNKEMKRKSIPRMLLNNGHTYYSTTKVTPGANTLVGSPLSAGVYEGVIKMVYDPLNNTLKEGEIMVTESTNPSWTPLFATAGALIMEYGGPMSHGGIVAREYGIPAVVGISAAMDVLKDGQRVRINGESGFIELLE